MQDELTEKILGAAMKVHSVLGPGLLESAYEKCLLFELHRIGLKVLYQVELPIVYETIKIDAGYRIDLLIGDRVIVELKSIEKILPIHKAQLLSYLKLSKVRIGLLLNFNVLHLKDGITRMVND
jgi:GxxExxY protein